MNFVTALGLLFTCDGDSNCFTVYKGYYTFVSCEIEITSYQTEIILDAVVHSVRRKKTSLFY